MGREGGKGGRGGLGYLLVIGLIVTIFQTRHFLLMTVWSCTWLEVGPDGLVASDYTWGMIVSLGSLIILEIGEEGFQATGISLN